MNGIGKIIPKAILLLLPSFNNTPSSLRTMQLSTSLASQTKRNENRCCVVEQKKSKQTKNETKDLFYFHLATCRNAMRSARLFIHMKLELSDVTCRATTNG